jgi:predicted transcriptional regulator
MHNWQETSLEAYYSRVLPSLGEKQRTVLQFLRRRGEAMTNAEIAQALNLQINTITPRILELRKMELVFDAGRRTCKVTGSMAHAWKAKHPVLPPAREEVKESQNQQTLL